MSYAPLSGKMFLARAKLKPQPDGSKTIYYGAYPGGFPERARVLIGCPLDVPMLHVCGGMARFYPYRRGFGRYDRTMDMNPLCNPDFLMDCNNPEWPRAGAVSSGFIAWGGILVDPPYTKEDSEHYPPGPENLPNPHQLVETAIRTLRVGYKVGILHYVTPRCPKNALFVASFDVTVGFGNRDRAFSVFEKLSE